MGFNLLCKLCAHGLVVSDFKLTLVNVFFRLFQQLGQAAYLLLMLQLQLPRQFLRVPRLSICQQLL